MTTMRALELLGLFVLGFFAGFGLTEFFVSVKRWRYPR